MLTVCMNGNAFDNTNASQNVMGHSANIPEEATAVKNDIYIPKAVNGDFTFQVIA
jgi:hypothetical protein